MAGKGGIENDRHHYTISVEIYDTDEHEVPTATMQIHRHNYVWTRR